MSSTDSIEKQSRLAHRLTRALELKDPRDGASPDEWVQVWIAREIEKKRCSLDKVYFINTWCWTYNPKLVGAVDVETGAKLDPWLPFDLFPKQEEFILWLEQRTKFKQDGHCAKSRDVGFTWMCGAFALNRWLFEDGYKANFGSRKAEYVDRIGDPDDCLLS